MVGVKDNPSSGPYICAQADVIPDAVVLRKKYADRQIAPLKLGLLQYFWKMKTGNEIV